MTTTSAPPEGRTEGRTERRGLAQYLPPAPSDAPIPLEHRAVRAVAERVWPYVSKGPDPDPDKVCWKWTGRGSASRSCLVSVHGEQVHAARLVWELSGRPNLQGCFLSPTCGYGADCLNPAHRERSAFRRRTGKGRSLWQILGLDLPSGPAVPSAPSPDTTPLVAQRRADTPEAGRDEPRRLLTPTPPVSAPVSAVPAYRSIIRGSHAELAKMLGLVRSALRLPVDIEDIYELLAVIADREAALRSAMPAVHGIHIAGGARQ